MKVLSAGALALLALSASFMIASGASAHFYEGKYAYCDVPKGSTIPIDLNKIAQQCSAEGNNGVQCSFDVETESQAWGVSLNASWVKTNETPAHKSDNTLKGVLAKAIKANKTFVCSPKGVAVTACSGDFKRLGGSGTCNGTINDNGKLTVYKVNWKILLTPK